MRRIACAALCAAAFAATARPDDAAATFAPSLTGLDLIELQIAYTTLLARFYRPVAPRRLVDGARTGIAAELYARGMHDAQLPFTPAGVGEGLGGDLVDGMVFASLARYGKRLDGHRLVEAAVRGELAALQDPYSLLFRPREFAKFDAFLGNQTFGGIGALLAYDATLGRALVRRVLPGGAAQRGGLQEGDAIVAVDGTAARTLGAGGIVRALRGPIGTVVHVEALRGQTTAAYAFVRAVVRDPQVEVRRFESVGYLRLFRFGNHAGTEVGAALADLRSQGVRGVVLDLRGNGGGYGDEATAVASAFIANGPIFMTRERGAAPVAASASGAAAFGAPLAVLVDHDTASAAEIVAGALQDTGGGTLVGAQTFGKGLVQSIFPLPDGSALKLTTARYTTPKGRDIDRVGIAPDVRVAEPPGSEFGDPTRDPQLAAALALLRAAP